MLVPKRKVMMELLHNMSLDMAPAMFYRDSFSRKIWRKIQNMTVHPHPLVYEHGPNRAMDRVEEVYPFFNSDRIFKDGAGLLTLSNFIHDIKENGAILQPVSKFEHSIFLWQRPENLIEVMKSDIMTQTTSRLDDLIVSLKHVAEMQNNQNFLWEPRDSHEIDEVVQHIIGKDRDSRHIFDQELASIMTWSLSEIEVENNGYDYSRGMTL